MKDQRYNVFFALLAAFLAVLLGTYAIYSDLRVALRENVESPIEFRLRETLNRGAPVSPLLKIFMLDDASVAITQTPDLSMLQWAKILRNVSLAKPKRILVDKVFGLLNDTQQGTAAAINIFEQIQTPIATGLFPSRAPITGRIETPPERIIHSQNNSELCDENRRSQSKMIYGAHEKIAPYFFGGHFLYINSIEFLPILCLQDGRQIPHLGLAPLSRYGASPSEVELGTAKVGNSWGGKMPLNYAPVKRLCASCYSMRPVIEALDTPAPVAGVQEGDTVLIIPQMFTGNTDFKDSPFGRVPGGFIIATIINSSLTESWLKHLPYPIFLLLAACGVMSLGILKTRGLISWLALFAVLILVTVGGLTSFCYLSITVPWFSIAVSSGMSGMSLLVIRSVGEARRERELREVSLQAKVLEQESAILAMKERILQEEKTDAAQVASHFLPEKHAPEWDTRVVRSFHRTLDAASGDWYTLENSLCGRFMHVLLLDVTGHGLRAALVVGCCRTLMTSIRAWEPQLLESEEFFPTFLRRLNLVLWKQGGGTHISAGVAVTITKESDKLHYGAFGNPPPLAHRPSDHKNIGFPCHGSALGAQETMDFAWNTGDLLPEFELLLFSDGIRFLDSRSAFKKFLIEIGAFSNPQVVLEEVLAAFTKSMDEKFGVQEDDQSLIVIGPRVAANV